ncbi:MAG: hypothetical protein AB7S93_00835 [Xanthobacteraceae bacterium]
MSAAKPINGRSRRSDGFRKGSTHPTRWHWSDISGGLQHRANRHYLHAYVWCDGMIAGELSHRCEHGPPPHRIKVCITRKGNEKFWRAIEAVAPPRLDPISGRRR